MKVLAMFISFATALLLALRPSLASADGWERTYGGAGDDFGYSVQQTSDGGYIIAGTAYSFGNNAQVYLIKTNASGDTLWTKSYGGTADDYGRSVRQTRDGGYIIAGWTWSYGHGYDDVYLIKTNAAGDTLWTKTYGGAGADLGFSVYQTTDGGYVVAGYTGSFGTYDVYLIKTNAAGDTLWTKHYDRGLGLSEWSISVQQTTDGGYIVAGTTGPSGSLYDVYLIKTNASGDTLWTRTYGGTGDDQSWSVQQTTDGGYIIAGYTNSFGHGGYDVYLIKTNALGDTLWTKTYGGSGDDEGYSVQQTTDGGYIVAGTTNSFGNGSGDVWLIKTNASGDTLWTRTYGGTNSDEGWSVQQTSDGGYIVAGYSAGYNYDVYLIKTDAQGSSGVETPVRQFDGLTVRQLKATPNPFTSFASIPGHEGERFALYDISGRKVGTYPGNRIGEGLKAGVYFLRPEGKGANPMRVVKLR